jgi:hypothetical protein
MFAGGMLVIMVVCPLANSVARRLAQSLAWSADRAAW